MSDALQIQVKVAATPEKVYQALMDAAALRAWFAEDAEVTPTHYNFWGRYTHSTPDRANGQHPILVNEPNKRLQYRWQINDLETTVQFDLLERDGQTLVVMTQSDGEKWSPWLTEDFWFLSLENLRRYAEGKRSDMRVDYTVSPTGDAHIEIEIDAPPSDVFPILIKPEQLRRWIASNPSVEPVVGGAYDFGWGTSPMKILELKENERLVVSDPDTNTVATWTLEGAGGKTRLTLVHSGFAPDYDNTGLKHGWRNFLNWIRGIAEEGSAWESPIKQIKEDLYPMYPATIRQRQAELALK